LLPASAGQPLEATSLSDYSIGLAWQPVAGVTTYRVYSDMGTGYGVYLFKAESDQPGLTDVNLLPGLRYNYRVGAVSRAGETMVANAVALTSGSASVAASGQGPGGASEQAPAKAAEQASLSAAKPARASAPLRITPAPTPLPPDTIILGMLSSTDYADEVDGTLTIVGEVRNDSALDVGETAVTATFYGTDGQVIGEVGGPTLLSTLTPGIRSPFMLTLPRPAGVANYSLRATGRPVTLAAADGGLVVVNTRRFEDTAGFYHIAGVVQNRETQKVEQARIVVTLYDRGGRVINVGFAYPQPSALAPGDRADFDVTFTYYPKVFSHAAVAVRD
jgi:hypothetical protein